MTGTAACITVRLGATGRVAFRDQSTWARDFDPSTMVTRPAACNGVTMCSDHARQSQRPSEDARLRLEYAFTSGTHAGEMRTRCVYCLKVGSFALHKSDPARLEICHLRSIARGGSSSAKVVAAGHRACNAAAGDRDLLGVLGEQRAWPTLKAAQAWARTPHRASIPNDLPTVEEMAQGRADRTLPDGTIGLGF